jgi:hypothetical protein
MTNAANVHPLRSSAAEVLGMLKRMQAVRFRSHHNKSRHGRTCCGHPRLQPRQDVDPRDKPGDDVEGVISSAHRFKILHAPPRQDHFMLNRLTRWLQAPPEAKASRAQGAVALYVAGRAVWTPRDYGALAREGFQKNAIVRCGW